MKKLFAIVCLIMCAFAASFTLTACSKKEEPKVKVGLICLHGETSTYDNNFIVAFKEACQAEGAEAIIKTNIREGNECYEAAAELAEDGCIAVFADSFGHESYLLKAAKEYPNVQFCHATGTKAHTENQENFGDAFASIYEGRYLAGVVAGIKLRSMMDADPTVQPVVGYVGAFTYAEVISGYTAWYLGVKSIVGNVTMKVTFTGSWYDYAAEAESAETLINAGCVIISQHADSMGAPTTCETKNVPNVTYNGSTADACPNTFLVSSRINWAPYFKEVIQKAKNNQKVAYDYVGTMANGSVELSALGTNLPAGTDTTLADIKSSLANGTIKVFDCSKFTVNGSNLTAYMADVDNSDFVGDTQVIKTANGITYFAESEFRSAPYFDLKIDGIELLNVNYGD